jgi:DNA-binding NarL/FixJ family response regulator
MHGSAGTQGRPPGGGGRARAHPMNMGEVLLEQWRQHGASRDRNSRMTAADRAGADGTAPCRIAMVEDRPELRVAMRRIVESQPHLRWCWEAETLQAARLNLDRPVDLLLLDLCLPDGDGLALMDAFRRHGKVDAKVVVFTVLGDEASVVRAIRHGAAGYLLKDASAAEIIDAIAHVLAGGAPLTPSVAAHLLRHVRRQEEKPSGNDRRGEHGCLESLTPREREVLLALARGFSYDETGRMLGISRHTIGHHVKQIYSKLMVNSRSQAVFEAVQAGWLHDEAR